VSDELELTILMPCLNEARTLGDCIRKARLFLEREGIRGEVLVADNGSTDGSQSIAESLGARVLPVPMRGYGAALHGGTLAARGRYVIMGDSDGSYDFADLMPFVEKLRKGYDLVMGNRFRGGIRPGAMPWKNRYLGNPLLSGLGRLMFRSPVRDFHCGLRGYSVEAYRRLDLRTTGMEYASEMVIKATLCGLRMTEVPTTLSPDERGRPPHLRPWRDGWRHVRFMLLYSPRWLFLVPGLVLMALGLAVAAWLLPGARVVGHVRFDVHTLLYAAMAVVIGFQAVAFAVFTKVFAISEGLLPEDPWLRRVARYVSVETGLVLGCVLFFSGLAGSAYALGTWGLQAFSDLDPQRTLRTVIPAVTALVLGGQVILASFFLSILGLGRRKGTS
jgi:glycosyltransferase involved in cell wall biosynthesis